MSVAQSNDLINHSFASIGVAQREKNHQVLQPILTDLISLGTLVKQLHWNVVGPRFRPIHLHLDEIHGFVGESTDSVAERLSATGHSPDGRLRATAKETELEDPPEGFVKDNEVLLLASHALNRTAELIRIRMLEIENEDTATADLLHQIVLELEKHHWMLQAQRV